MTLVRQVTARKVDWFRLTADLRNLGLTLKIIAAATGISKPTLLDLRNQDADPKMHQGELLIALWMRETGRPAGEVPRHGDAPSNKPVCVQAPAGGSIRCPLCDKEHLVRAAKT
jgi:hypothetical protein